MKLLFLTGYAGYTFRTHNICKILKKKHPLKIIKYVYGEENFNWLKKHKGFYEKLYSVDKIYNNIQENLNSIDSEHEKKIIELVKNSKLNFTKVLYAERVLVQHTHENYYSKKFNQKEINYFLINIYEHLRESLKDVKLVYAYHSSSIFSYLLSEICKEKKILFKTIVHDRISKNFFFSNDNSQLLPAEIINKYKNNYFSDEESKVIVDEFIDNLKNGIRSNYVISGQIQNLALLKINSLNVKNFFKNFFLKESSKMFLQKTNFQRIKEKISLKYNQYKSIKYFKDEINFNYKYLYIPLQYAPETTTLISAVDQYDQLSMIKKISVYIPPDWKVVIKEHPSMLGKRDYNFYREINKIFNMFLINPLYDSIKLIKNSSATLSLCGTSGLEAYSLNKPTMLLGNIHYEILKGIIKINNYNEIYNILMKISENKDGKIIAYNPREELYKFIASLKSGEHVVNNYNDFWSDKTHSLSFLDTDFQIAKSLEKFLKNN